MLCFIWRKGDNWKILYRSLKEIFLQLSSDSFSGDIQLYYLNQGIFKDGTQKQLSSYVSTTKSLTDKINTGLAWMN